MHPKSIKSNSINDSSKQFLKSDTIESSDEVSSLGGMSSRMAPTNVYTENTKVAIMKPFYGKTNGLCGAAVSKNVQIAATKASQLET